MSGSERDFSPLGKSAETHAVLIDAHVHFHDCFDADDFLEFASENFRAGAANMGLGPNVQRALMLSESNGSNWFRRLRDLSAEGAELGRWRLQSTSENCSVIAMRSGCGHVAIIAGRQVVTSERLEVLALGTSQEFSDGNSLSDTIDAIQQADGLVVLPWGFGKWLGGRGRLIDATISRNNSSRLFLGDNAGRMALWPEPRQFSKARGMGIRILPGTDPLPFRSQVHRPGAYGLAVGGQITESRPAVELKGLLRNVNTVAVPYGKLETTLRFIKHQVAMNVRKRFSHLRG